MATVDPAPPISANGKSKDAQMSHLEGNDGKPSAATIDGKKRRPPIAAALRWSKSTRMSAMLALNGAMFLAEIVVGYLVGSMALVTDSFHMLGDVLAMLVALYAVRVRAFVDQRVAFGFNPVSGLRPLRFVLPFSIDFY